MTERKEVVELSGSAILIVTAFLGVLFVAGIFYRWHNYQVFRETKVHHLIMAELEANQKRDLKNEIVELEGAKSWSETAYVRSHSE